MLTKRKRTTIERRIAADPAASNRALAREFGIDDKTIAAIRKGLAAAEIPHANDRNQSRNNGRKPRPSAAIAQSPAINGDERGASNFGRTLGDENDQRKSALVSGGDPVQILRDIANDPRAPATARVAAAKALLAIQKPTAADKAAEAVDNVTRRALELVGRAVERGIER